MSHSFNVILGMYYKTILMPVYRIASKRVYFSSTGVINLFSVVHTFLARFDDGYH